MRAPHAACAVLLLACLPAHGALSDATGLVKRIEVDGAGRTFEVESVANFDVHDFEWDGGGRLTLHIRSDLDGNLGELVIPAGLMSGNLTFLLNGEDYAPQVLSNGRIHFVTVAFEGAGENRLEVLGDVPHGAGPAAAGGGCLVATAAYGTELAPRVQQLRELRDSRLLSTEHGAALVAAFNAAYYSVSPAIADYERQHPAFREMVRIAITPAVDSLLLLGHVGSDGLLPAAAAALVLLNLAAFAAVPAAACLAGRALRTRA